MCERKKLQNLNDYFLELKDRSEGGVFFCRMNGYNAEIGRFIQKYFEEARKFGVVIEGKIPNPNEQNLAYYQEIMGTDFQLSVGFFHQALKKWLPRMKEHQQKSVSVALYDTLDNLRKAGKNDNMLRNAYIKFMCWMYYKFERIVNCLGENKVPKILYEGDISYYELLLFSVLSNAGCDIVLLQYKGDQNYRKTDSAMAFSEEFRMPDMGSFPEHFNLRKVREELQKQADRKRLYRTEPKLLNCTNAWIQGKGLEDIKTSTLGRGSDPNLFYNCFIRICGVEDKLTYLNELYQFHLELKNSGRKVVIVDNEILKPTMEEIAAVHRKNYSTKDQMLMDLAAGIQYGGNVDLQQLMQKAFLDIMIELSEMECINLNKLMNKAVYLICWLKRYQSKLFLNWKKGNISCMICFNGCKSETEAMFYRFLAKLPVDVLLLHPNQNEVCPLKDNALYEIHYNESMAVEKFPTEDSQIHMETAAYHAEQELDTLMYQDSGIYRNQQYKKANAVSLKTTYEELSILWNQDLLYRPNFSTINDLVNMPVLFAKVSGVKDGMVQQYWSGIKSLFTKDLILAKSVPYIRREDNNPMKACVTEFWKNGRLCKAKIKSHKLYQYGALREEMQEHILEKLEDLIEQRTIRGTFENGTEYTILSTVLNLNREITRLLQKFDFTKKNPKFIYIHTTEEVSSLEDAILAAFLNLVGFDVLVFAPTGYQSIEKYFTQKILEEHQIGEYIYDLTAPDFRVISSNTRPSWRERLFKRGR